jgi:tRNA threonylcarbamoyladenosine biosynthesis protein TsaB
MLLAIDTSTRAVGVALYDGAQVLGETVWNSQDYHTVDLAPAVAQILEKAGLHVASLQALAVALGPGSFTGLRVGLALAKGLSLARRLPILGISTFDVLAAALPVKDIPLAVVLRAGRGRLAVGWYHNQRQAWVSAGRAELLASEALIGRIEQPTLVCGELTVEERQAMGKKRRIIYLASPAQSLRRPSYLAELAWKKWQSAEMGDPARLAPVYLHDETTSSG